MDKPTSCESWKAIVVGRMHLEDKEVEILLDMNEYPNPNIGREYEHRNKTWNMKKNMGKMNKRNPKKDRTIIIIL